MILMIQEIHSNISLITLAKKKVELNLPHLYTINLVKLVLITKVMRLIKKKDPIG